MAVVLLPALSHAEKVDEVLVAWRGSMPKRLFEVIHGGTGEFIRMLDPTVPVLASSHRRQISVKAINPSVFKSWCCYSFRCCTYSLSFYSKFLICYILRIQYYVCFCGVNVGVEFMCFA